MVGGKDFSVESGCLKVQPKAGGKLHLRLNIPTRPIVDKYREGKLKSTLKRESRGRETTRSANGWSREGRTRGDSARGRAAWCGAAAYD